MADFSVVVELDELDELDELVEGSSVGKEYVLFELQFNLSHPSSNSTSTLNGHS